jgi:hypothetical protein
MKFYTFFFLTAIFSIGCNPQKESIPVPEVEYDKIWVGSYTGRSNISKKNSQGQTSKSFVDVQITITAGSDSGNKDIEIAVEFFYDRVPQKFILQGNASGDSFAIFDKIFNEITRKDANGNPYRIDFSNGSGMFLNASKDVKISISEKRLYFTPDLQTLNYESIHTIEFSKIK